MLVLFGLTSCEQETVNKKAKLPIEIVNLKEINKFDTVLVINSEDKTYLFKSNKEEYIGAFDNINTDGNVVLFLFIVLVLMMIILLLD